MSSMDESDLRALRDQLHAALPAAIPAAAGRPLCRRIAGNMPGLVDDCWALGYSTAQCMLTQRANTATLRPAGRNPLPPPGPARGTPLSSDTCSTSVTTSLEAIISTQLRMEQEVRELRTRHAAQQACNDRLQLLELEVAGLREDCAARDARIEQLQLLVEDLLGRENLPPRPAMAEPATAPSGSRENVPESAAGENQTNRNAAREIAAGLDLRALGEAIASALQWRVGESDSEPEQQPACAERRPGSLRTAQPPDHRQAAPTTSASSSSAPTGPGGLIRQRNVVTGSGPPSTLIQDASHRQESHKEKFILEGIRLDASDRDVRSLVWTVVSNLHDFQRLPSRGSAVSATRAFLIEIDADDAGRVLDPSSWPTGLVVRRRSGAENTGRQGQRFRRPAAASGRSQASTARGEHENAAWQATSPRHQPAATPNPDTARDVSTAQGRNGAGSWESAVPRRPGAPNRGAAHATGPSWAAVASCHGRGDTTRGGGGWEATAPHRDGASTQVRYHGWYGQPERGADSWEECPDGGNWGAARPRRRRRWPRRNGAGQGLDYQYGWEH